MKKKLSWIEFTNSGPDVLVWPFEIVGFDVRVSVCELRNSLVTSEIINDAFLNIESWLPDVVVFWLARSLNYPDGLTHEPAEMIRFRERIRRSPKLKRVRLVAFIDSDKMLPLEESGFRDHYDYISLSPLKIIEHALVVKRLIGDKPSGFEGVMRYLSNNGKWEMVAQPMHVPHQISGWLSVKGKFSRSPKTRLINSEKYEWVKNGIKENTSTIIVCLRKEVDEWRKGFGQAEINFLLELQEREKDLSHQFLLGVNSSFLEIGEDNLLSSVKQVYESGKWQIFLVDHMWAENMWLAFFDNLFYEKEHLEQRTIDYAKIINI